MNRDFAIAVTPGWHPGGLWVLPALILVGLWVLLARSRLLRGDQSVERSERVPQLYAYTVCLIAIVVLLSTVGSVVGSMFTLADPLTGSLESNWGPQPVLTSFEAYHATVDQPGPWSPAKAAPDSVHLSTAQLRAQYEALRQDRMVRGRAEAARDLTRGGLLVVLSIVLFAWHWRLVRRRADTDGYSGERGAA